MFEEISFKFSNDLVIHGDHVVVGAVIVALLCLLRRYMAGGVCRCVDRLDGKTVIITGSNTGIGKTTALALAKKGARVVLACRNLDKAEATADELKRLSKNTQIVIAKLDLSSLVSVRRFCAYIHESERRLDILINNAGVYWLPRMITEDGYEMTFQANYLGHFLMTLLLLNKMRANAVSRIINVSSVAHNVPTNFDDLNATKRYRKLEQYAKSKLAQIMFTRLLATKLANVGEKHITVNALHPGVITTEIFRTIPFVSTWIGSMLCWPINRIFYKTPDEGAQTTIHCAVSEECSTLTGRYFKDCKVTEPDKQATDDQQAEQLWNVSLKLVGITEDDPAIAFLNVKSTKSE